MLTLDNFESAVNSTIVERGQDYFSSQAVEFLEENPPGTWTASVVGSEDYEVEVVLSGTKIKTHSCDCPYDGGPVCKHVVAVFYALREELAQPVAKPAKSGKLTFEDVLLKTNLEELRQFVREQKQQDRDFGDKFMLFFADKDPEMDLTGKYEGIIRKIIRSHSNRGYMDYRQTFLFAKEIRATILSGDNAVARKNYREALALGQVLCREMMPVVQACDDSAANIGEVVSFSIQILENIAKARDADPELLDQLLKYIEVALVDKSWFEYGDYGYELLDVAEKTALRIEPDRYLKLLDALTKIHTGRHGDYEQEHFKKRKIRFYEQTGRLDEAEKLIAANMEIVEVRQNEVQKAIAKNEFARAKQLIAEGIQIAEGKRHPGTVSKWEKVLLDIARAEKDVATERYLAKKFAFDRGFSTQYYQAWKSTFPPEAWAAAIETHIQSVIAEENAKPRKFAWEHLDSALYFRLSPVFIQEEQWERLLELATKVCSESVLSTVHPHLCKQYPATLLAMYLPVLEKMGDDASNRKAYEHLAAMMKKIKKDIAGSHAVIDDLVARVMQKYPRRPAMLEELKKITKH